MANILPKEEFNKLSKDEQKELMETWRETATNRDIYNAMGISSDRYYKMCRKLDVKPKTLHSMETDTPMTKEEEEVVTEVEVEPDELRDIFLKHDVNTDYEIKFKSAKKDKLVEFMCEEHGFSESRVLNVTEKLKKLSSTQKSLEDWF